MGERVLLKSDLMGKRETIGGEMWRTILRIDRYGTLLVVDDDSHVVEMDAEERSAGVVDESVGQSEYNIAGQ